MVRQGEVGGVTGWMKKRAATGWMKKRAAKGIRRRSSSRGGSSLVEKG